MALIELIKTAVGTATITLILASTFLVLEIVTSIMDRRNR